MGENDLWEEATVISLFHPEKNNSGKFTALTGCKTMKDNSTGWRIDSYRCSRMVFPIVLSQFLALFLLCNNLMKDNNVATWENSECKYFGSWQHYCTVFPLSLSLPHLKRKTQKGVNTPSASLFPLLQPSWSHLLQLQPTCILRNINCLPQIGQETQGSSKMRVGGRRHFYSTFKWALHGPPTWILLWLFFLLHQAYCLSRG